MSRCRWHVTLAARQHRPFWGKVGFTRTRFTNLSFSTPIVHFRWWKDTFKTMFFYFIRIVSPKKRIFCFAIATYIIIRRCLKVMKFRSNCWIDDDFIFTRYFHWGYRKATDCSHCGYVSLEPLCRRIAHVDSSCIVAWRWRMKVCVLNLFWHGIFISYRIQPH